MNCNEFELLVLTLARDELMGAGARELSLAHAESCPTCSGRLSSERFLIAGARAVVAEIAAEEAPARLEAALLAAFREHAFAKTSPAVIPMPNNLNSSWFWKSAAVAAGILVLISTVAVFWLYSNSSDQELTGLVAPLSVPELVSPALKSGLEQVSFPDVTISQVPSRHRSSRRKSLQAEVVTEFYPLLEGVDMDSEGVSQVVRVELPASALSAAGVSVGPDMSTVPVKADVVLGYDGLARAIRFVR